MEKFPFEHFKDNNMARLENLPEPQYSHLLNLECPTYPDRPWTVGPPLNQRRIALISTAGLHPRGAPPFIGFSNEYRVIPGTAQAKDLVMSHISTNFDRSGFFEDWNVVFPLDRLRELAEKKVIASVADYHYSFMGATDPRQMEGRCPEVADLLKRDQVNGVLLVPA